VIGISLGVCLAIRAHATNRPSFGSWRGTPPGDFIKTYLHPVTDWQAALHELLSVLADTVIDPTVNRSAHVPVQKWDNRDRCRRRILSHRKLLSSPGSPINIHLEAPVGPPKPLFSENKYLENMHEGNVISNSPFS
jgi:hypothetical protein